MLMSNRLTEQKQYEQPEGQLQKEDTWIIGIGDITMP